VEISITGETIIITGTRPATDEPNIYGNYNVTITRENINTTLSIYVNLTAEENEIPTLILTPPAVTITDTALSTTVTASGTATGTITIDDSGLPAAIEVTATGNEITVTGTRPAASESAISGTFNIFIIRQNVPEPLEINVNLTPVAPTLSIIPTSVTINDTSLEADVTASGTATGAITFDRGTLPLSIQLSATGNTITVTGTRPAADQPPISGTHNVTVIRQGTNQNLEINLDLTPVSPTVEFSSLPVSIYAGNLLQTITVGGTATGNLQNVTTTGTVPSGVTVNHDAAAGTVTIVGVRPTTTAPPPTTQWPSDALGFPTAWPVSWASSRGDFAVNVTREGVTQSFPVNVNLSTTFTSPHSINTLITPQAFVNSIGPGWNLGNTLDSHVTNSNQSLPQGWTYHGGGLFSATSVMRMETEWVLNGWAIDSFTTRGCIQAVYDAGFTAIRIPVTWHKAFIPNSNYTIRADWMARVRQIVGWAYEMPGMHIILNTHHENQAIWLASGPDNSTIDQSEIILTRIWEQVAGEFRDFNERLIFAGLNEPRMYSGAPRPPGIPSWQEWNGGIPETRNNLNRLNQAFVNTVRDSGGNNEHRFLMVPTHAASSSDAAFGGTNAALLANPLINGAFRIPNDPRTDGARIILAVHTYSPFAWAHDGIGSYTGPGTGSPESIQASLDRVQAHATRLGVPVILSEWGSVMSGTNAALNLAQRRQHAHDYVSFARARGMATFWWDNNNSGTSGSHRFGLFRRENNAATSRTVVHPTIIKAIIDAHNGIPLSP
jgi:aryl-phospho-beta-D-glucosidase BglC (GH1 family)